MLPLIRRRSLDRAASGLTASASARRPRRRSGLNLERLEDRRLLATFTVTSNGDNGGVNPAPGAGTGTFRQAIVDANAAGGSNDVAFSIGSGPSTISVLSPLPTISSTLAIKGGTQPGFNSNSPVRAIITLDGSNAGVSGVRGLEFNGGATNSQVLYITVQHFSGDGIAIVGPGGLVLDGDVVNQNGGNGIKLAGGAANTVIQNSYIGTDAAGGLDLGNTGDGVLLADNANNNSIGGTNFATQRNVISGNGGNGIRITDAANVNRILSNIIGLTADQTAALANDLNGILVESTGAGNVIGSPGGVVVSGNGQHGISIAGAAPGTVVYGAIVGVSGTTSDIFGNRIDGINVTATGAGIVIRDSYVSGNRNDGIELGGNSAGVRVIRNLIGTDLPSAKIIANLANGIHLTGNTAFNVIGGLPTATVQTRNVISGNLGSGILMDSNSNHNVIQNNEIGVGLNKILPVPNHSSGIEVRDASSDNLIGGGAAILGNIIAHNLGYGVVLVSGQRNSILSNSIHSNSLRGILLGGGANGGQPAPKLNNCFKVSPDSVKLAGTVYGTPNTQYQTQFFANAEADGTGYGEGQFLLSTVTIRTNARGQAQFKLTLPAAPANTKVFTATATSPTGNTSAFSNAVPPSRPPWFLILNQR